MPMLRTLRLELIAADEGGWQNWEVLKIGRGRNAVGSIGFAGPPSESGEVRMICEVVPAFRKKGYATEAMGALIDWAFEDPRVRGIVVHTEARLADSIRVIEKNGLSLESGAAEGRVVYALRRKGER